jgi:hypothetical protein
MNANKVTANGKGAERGKRCICPPPLILPEKSEVKKKKIYQNLTYSIYRGNKCA